MNNKEHYILFCTKFNKNKPADLFFILNTNPLLFTDDISKAKKYNNRILAMNDNIDSTKDLLAKKLIDSVYMGVVINNREVGRIKLL